MYFSDIEAFRGLFLLPLCDVIWYSAFDGQSHFTEITVFWMLDTLHPTATGLDQIPAWFLRLGAPIFAAPLARLFDQSLATGVVPQQWKTAIISLLPKIPTPTQESDFRPISVMPVLSRTLERFVVRTYIYPALLQPCQTLDFSDQFAFRPSGSTTAAILALLHTVRTMLDENISCTSSRLTSQRRSTQSGMRHWWLSLLSWKYLTASTIGSVTSSTTMPIARNTLESFQQLSVFMLASFRAQQ